MTKGPEKTHRIYSSKGGGDICTSRRGEWYSGVLCRGGGTKEVNVGGTPIYVYVCLSKWFKPNNSHASSCLT